MSTTSARAATGNATAVEIHEPWERMKSGGAHRGSQGFRRSETRKPPPEAVLQTPIKQLDANHEHPMGAGAAMPRSLLNRDR